MLLVMNNCLQLSCLVANNSETGAPEWCIYVITHIIVRLRNKISTYRECMISFVLQI